MNYIVLLTRTILIRVVASDCAVTFPELYLVSFCMRVVFFQAFTSSK